MINEKLNRLTPHKRAFVLEYLKDFKSSKAAERSGINASVGSSLLKETDVHEAIEEQMAMRVDRMQIDADWVLQQLGEMFTADMADIFHPGTNDLRPIHEWPLVWRRMTTGVKVDDKNTRDGTYTVKDVKILDRLRALEMIGKHTSVRAFQDQIKVTTDQELTERLMAGRKRARKRARQHSEDDDTPNFM